jgi:hypothetical protein
MVQLHAFVNSSLLSTLNAMGARVAERGASPVTHTLAIDDQIEVSRSHASQSGVFRVTCTLDELQRWPEVADVVNYYGPRGACFESRAASLRFRRYLARVRHA